MSDRAGLLPKKEIKMQSTKEGRIRFGKGDIIKAGYEC
jgi:hypothetical protein